MFVNELDIGAQVTIELVKDAMSFELSTCVMGAMGERKTGRVVLGTIIYQGKRVDLENGEKLGMSFNLYAMDSYGKRVCWSDVKISASEWDGYIVQPPIHRINSSLDERRTHPRMVVNLPGILYYNDLRRNCNVMIQDISSSGVCFTTRQKLDIMEERCRLDFSDIVNKKSYDLSIHGKCVRIQEGSSGYLYGCHVKDASKQMLTYTYLKEIMERKFFEQLQA